MRARSLVVGLLAGSATALALTVGPVASADEPAGVSPKIVGGTDADQEYSFMVSLSTDGDHFCGGSLIDAEWVVTAAHCVEGKDPSTVALRIGSNDRTTGGEEAQAAELIPNPDWDANPGNDIALVKLAAPATSTPIAIADSAEVGTESRIIGWGQTCPGEGCPDLPTMLQQLDTSVVDAGECTKIDGTVELCTDNPGDNAGACYGDSGGPQIVKDGEDWKLIGDTSRSGNGDPNCATGPSIYTNVTKYTDWISSTMGG